tara:strand:- start:79654 stop:82251 length:2598 start_codon:yes stop_codon:yes gene_type:complete
MRNYLIAISILISVLTACKPTENSAVYLDNAVELAAVEVFSESPYRASRTRTIDIIHTDLKVRFDWDKQYLNGEAKLTLKPYFYKTDRVVLDAKGMEIKSVALLDGSLTTILDYSYTHDVLAIQLPRNFGNTEILTIKINYVAKPEERLTNAGSAVTDDKGLYFINPLNDHPNKPQQLWTQGETEANSVWFPTIDSPNERCTHQIEMTVDSKFVTLSNGDMVSSVTNSDGTRTDTWVQNKPIAPYLFMMAVSEFAVVEDELAGMKVDYYVDKDYEPYAREIFKNTPEMISFYSDLLGYPYPWSKYSQVIVHDYVSGAMENVGAVIFGDFVQQTSREMIDGDNESTVAHELFHHWFGDVVTCESWSNLPLNESFANYGEYLWAEHKYGKLIADESLYYELGNYLNEVRNGAAKDMIRFHYNKPDDMFDSHSYAKGGRILHMLRNYVGDEAFFAALKQYLHENEFTSVEIHQLRLAFEEVTGEDLNWFFNQWFLGKGHPDLEITYAYDSTKMIQHITVEQLQDLEEYAMFKLPVDIDVYQGGARQTYSVMVDSIKQTFSFKVDAKPDLVNFDARKILVCTKTENHTMQEMKFMYANAPLYMDKREAVEFAYKETEEVNVAKEVLLDAMLDNSADIRSLAVSKYDKFDEIEDLKLKNVLISTMQHDENSEVRYEAVFALSDYYSWAEGLSGEFENQINKDSSYLVISGLIESLAVVDSTLGLKYAKRYENEDNVEVLLACAEVYSAFGNDDNNPFFNRLYPKTEGYNVMGFINYYQDYLMRVDNIQIQKSGLAILEKEAQNELAWFVRYYAVSGMVNLKDYYKTMAKKHRKNGDEEKAVAYDNLQLRIDDRLTELQKTEEDGRVFMDR